MPEWESETKTTETTAETNDDRGDSMLSSAGGFPRPNISAKRFLNPQVEDIAISDIQENENIPVNGRAESHAVRCIFHLSGMAFGEDGNALFDAGMAVIYKLLEKRNNGG